MKKTKILLSLVLALVLCTALFLPLSAAYTYQKVTTLQTGDYVMVITGITPTNYSRGDYYMTSQTARNPGLLFQAYSSSSDATTWRITRVSSTKCTIQNLDKGNNGYLNITKDTLSYGTRQELNYTWTSEGRCKFYATVDGGKYYIRFTNSSQNESRFHAGTSDSNSCWFKLLMKKEIPTSDAASQPKPAEDPLMTIACISDAHVDYGLQYSYPFIRTTLINALEQISEEEDPDLLLVGGDSTSDNDDTPEPNEWTPAIYQKVVDAYALAVERTIASNRSLWASGNHDCEAGTYDKYDSYAGFVELMKDTCGNPLAVYRQKDDSTVSKASDPDYVKNYVMGLHYNIDGFDFIILNAPHMGDDTLSTGTINWFDSRMKTIDSSKTVFLICHYPLNDSRGLSNSSYGLKGSLMTQFKNVLTKYPNLIYLYGHNHGTTAGIPAYITDDTYQRITMYSPDGSILDRRDAVPTSFISSFMGSMGYYTSSGLGAANPNIVQALMIYIYKDRIVFQMKNYGSSSQTLDTWTVMRDIEGSLDDGSSDTTDTSKPNSSTSNKPNSSSSNPTSSTSAPVGGETTDTGTPDNSTQSTDTATQPTDTATQPTDGTSDAGSQAAPNTDRTSNLQSSLHPDESMGSASSQDSTALPTGARIGIIAGGAVLLCGVVVAGILIFKKKAK